MCCSTCFLLKSILQVVRCKKGKSGLHAMKTQQAVLIAVYNEPVQHSQVASIVETLGDHFISVQY